MRRRKRGRSRRRQPLKKGSEGHLDNVEHDVAGFVHQTLPIMR